MTATNVEKKLVYAYPTSTHAEKYNNGKGCWLVMIGRDCGKNQVWKSNDVTVFQTENEAREHLGKLEFQLNKWSN